MTRTEHEIYFEFPYDLSNGGTAAYFDCSVRVLVDWGMKPIYQPWPGDPGHGPGVEEIFGLEVDGGRAGWCVPDPGLAKRIYEWLEQKDDWLIDKAREDKAFS